MNPPPQKKKLVWGIQPTTPANKDSHPLSKIHGLLPSTLTADPARPTQMGRPFTMIYVTPIPYATKPPSIIHARRRTRYGYVKSDQKRFSLGFHTIMTGNYIDFRLFACTTAIRQNPQQWCKDTGDSILDVNGKWWQYPELPNKTLE